MYHLGRRADGGALVADGHMQGITHGWLSGQGEESPHSAWLSRFDINKYTWKGIGRRDGEQMQGENLADGITHSRITPRIQRETRRKQGD